MVSDSDLVTRLREILSSSDLETTTPATVRRQLEADFGVELTDKKAFIRDQIDAFLESNGGVEGEENNPDSPKAEEEDADEEDDGDEEKEERPVKAKKRGGGGFAKVCQLSPQLEKFIGSSQLARTEVVKKMWVYIKEKDLQDPKDRRKILCDESLHSLFHVKSINMFQMNKALAKHIWPLGDGGGDGCVTSVKEEEDEGDASGERDEKGDKNEEMEENNEEESEEEVRSLRKRKRKKPAKSEEKPKRKGGGGFAKVCSLSPELQAFTGMTKLARTEVVKMLWKYIKENSLQDPKDGRTIICDEALRSLFSLESINMFQMNKHLTKHIWPLEDNAGESAGSSSPKNGKLKMETEDGDTESDELNENEEKPKKESCGLLAPLPLSDALIRFLGDGESSLSRADVVKRLWEYIEQNDLQDPSDKRRIICDEKLKELFEVDSFEDISVSKLLTSHYVKIEQ
ncbi:SWIB complex BAF60b domain-containing protein [Hirschfeldia incana]|nr:SWIB complex BAF60b domain-containing protein [Hirschfeldia incana]